MIDLEWIRELVAVVDESGIDSLEISRFGTHVKVRKSPPAADEEGEAIAVTGTTGARGSGADDTQAGAPAPAPASSEGAESAAGTAGETAEPGAEAAAEPAEELFEVESPMVGTFYRAPAPDAPPYVEMGDRVGEGQTLCILEAMKLMNELESEIGGSVREICVQNAEPVEYGQVLFRIAAD